ncbi:Hypothetical protein AA314_01257 [Archangium gephyra]|uniref:Uncharacterized protein n=1 Tax=Archangium gephyra TaxID=48 RepID=A0AAC8Q3C5_9BACT|nr:Hypothetical protein AA314_01257 [Archangium gephyra]
MEWDGHPGFLRLWERGPSASWERGHLPARAARWAAAAPFILRGAALAVSPGRPGVGV